MRRGVAGEYLGESKYLGRALTVKQTELLRSLDRLSDVGIALAKSRKTLESQRFKSYSHASRINSICQRMDAISRAA